MDFEPLKEVGHRLGTAAIMVFDQSTCLVGATLNLIEYFARESCGYCTPCREGLPYIRDLLQRMEDGEGKEEFIPMLQQMARHMDKRLLRLCPRRGGAGAGATEIFRGEIREHISQKKCPFGRQPAIPAAVVPGGVK